MTKQLKEHSVANTNLNYVHGNFLDIVMELVLFREALQKGIYHHPSEIIQQAQDIDANLAKFAQEMPPRAQFQSHRFPTRSIKQLTYDGYFHGTPLTR